MKTHVPPPARRPRGVTRVSLMTGLAVSMVLVLATLMVPFETIAVVRAIGYRRNINTLEQEQGISELKMNDIGEVTIHTANPIVFDAYNENHVTGSVVFIDPDTNETVGAGMIK